MVFSRPIEDVIMMRHSVRSFSDDSIPASVLDEIFNYIKSVDNLFQGDVSIYLVRKEDLPPDVKLGTYGMIKGGKYYLIGVSGPEDNDKLALGYMLEKVVLFLTDKGLGSVWLGGTFSRPEFEKTVSILGNQKVQIVIPFGYEGGKKTLLGMLAGNNRSKRKSFEELFSVKKEEAGEYFLPLEMLRQAPSGVNRQPWACLVKEKEVDFYLTEQTNLSHIDMGIGLAHFLLTCEEKGIQGHFTKKEDKESNIGKYIGTF